MLPFNPSATAPAEPPAVGVPAVEPQLDSVAPVGDVCLIDGDGTVVDCAATNGSVTPIAFGATADVIYGVADERSFVRVMVDGAEQSVTRSPQVTDGHRAFHASIPSSGEVAIEVLDSLGNVLQHADVSR